MSAGGRLARKKAVAPSASATSPLRVALIGNPNTGKTTLFNALTGLRQHVANFPGVTVERVEGSYRALDGRRVSVIDLPGCMTLAPNSPDERITVETLLGNVPGVERPHVVAVVVSAMALERGLFLAIQVADLGLPTVVVLNQVDAAAKAGITIDVPELIHEIGMTVIPTVATRQTGMDILRRVLAQAPTLPLPPRRFTSAAIDRSVEAGDAARRFEWIHGVVERTVTRRVAARQLTDRADTVILHHVWGPVLFLLLMALVFQAIFSWAQPIMDAASAGTNALGVAIAGRLPPGDFRSLIVDGAIAGVGNVVVFVPQIALLFLFIGLLEDSGYMARAAFLMDRFMRRVGLPGKAFIPMLSGYACAVPAIMATRTIEDRGDRLATIMVVPLMSCSARLPVYTVLIGAFVPAVRIDGIDLRGLTLLGLYLLGTISAFGIAAVFRRVLLRTPVRAFLIELPAYHIPAAGPLLMNVWHRTTTFLKRAGTVILAFSVILWALASYPRRAPGTGETPAAAREQQLMHSALGRVGQAIEPAVKPLGYDWKLAVSMVASFGARETFVSTMATLHGLGSDESPAGALSERLRNARDSRTGRAAYTPLIAVGLMVFYVFALMCTSTVAVTVRETGGGAKGLGWAALQFTYMSSLAYAAAWIVYHGGRALGYV